jgi:hypothetical protein
MHVSDVFLCTVSTLGPYCSMPVQLAPPSGSEWMVLCLAGYVMYVNKCHCCSACLPCLLWCKAQRGARSSLSASEDMCTACRYQRGTCPCTVGMLGPGGSAPVQLAGPKEHHFASLHMWCVMVCCVCSGWLQRIMWLTLFPVGGLGGSGGCLG